MTPLGWLVASVNQSATPPQTSGSIDPNSAALAWLNNNDNALDLNALRQLAADEGQTALGDHVEMEGLRPEDDAFRPETGASSFWGDQSGGGNEEAFPAGEKDDDGSTFIEEFDAPTYNKFLHE
eukprot:320881_1